MPLAAGTSEYRPSLTARDGAEDRDQAEREQDPVRTMQPPECDLWCRCRPVAEVAGYDERLSTEATSVLPRRKRHDRFGPVDLRIEAKAGAQRGRVRDLDHLAGYV